MINIRKVMKKKDNKQNKHEKKMILSVKHILFSYYANNSEIFSLSICGFEELSL
jgi:hypothetical protein